MSVILGRIGEGSILEGSVAEGRVKFSVNPSDLSRFSANALITGGAIFGPSGEGGGTGSGNTGAPDAGRCDAVDR
jgi:hypothetical protein